MVEVDWVDQRTDGAMTKWTSKITRPSLANRFGCVHMVDDELLRMSRCDVDRLVRDQMARRLGHQLMEQVPIEKKRDPDRPTTEYRVDVYVFTPEQLMSYVRDVLDECCVDGSSQVP